MVLSCKILYPGVLLPPKSNVIWIEVYERVHNVSVSEWFGSTRNISWTINWKRIIKLTWCAHCVKRGENRLVSIWQVLYPHLTRQWFLHSFSSGCFSNLICHIQWAINSSFLSSSATVAVMTWFAGSPSASLCSRWQNDLSCLWALFQHEPYV